jgi:hypothetical protein
VTVDLAADVLEAGWRAGLGYFDFAAFSQSHAAESLLSQADLACRDDRGIVGDGKGGEDFASFAGYADLAQGLELLGGIAIPVPQQESGILWMGIDRDLSDLQHGLVPDMA